MLIADHSHTHGVIVTNARVQAGRFIIAFAASVVGLLSVLSGGPAIAAEEGRPSPTAPAVDSAVSAPAADTAEPGAEPAAPTEAESSASLDSEDSSVTPSVRISGNIWRMNPGLVFLRTPIGLMTLSCKTCLRDLRGNPTITLYLNGPHGAVDITPRGAGAPSRRYLWGPVAYSTPDKKQLTLWTPEGEEQFAVDSMAPKLASVPSGRKVTIEVNDSGKILGVHDLQFDLQVSQLPSHSSQTEMKVTGSVSKIKNGYVHVQTDVGVLPITFKTGLCHKKERCYAKVGQDLTLWIHDTSIAIDLYAPGSRTPDTRLLSGKLAYGSPDKSTLLLWTPDGEQSIPVDQVKGSAASLKEGVPIIVALDGDGAIQQIRKGN